MGKVKVELRISQVHVGVVVGRGLKVQDADEALQGKLDRACAEARGDDTVKKAVRDLLRFGRYKPTGRQKPASEYLLSAAQKDRFPRINNLVDVNNLVSLQTGLPISLVDLRRARTEQFCIRRGREGEAFVFNSAQQTIALHDLLLLARLPEDAPCANPVKDSMATKLQPDSSEVMAVLYAPPSLKGLLVEAVSRLEALLAEHGCAPDAQVTVIEAQGPA